MSILLSDSFKVINWDLDTKSLDTKYWGKVTDSGRGCKVALLQNGVLKTPSTETMRINFKKPSGLQIFLDGVISGNYFVFDFTEQVFAEQGEVMAELMLNVGGEWLMSSTFYIQVDQSFTSAIESSEELTALQTALAVVDEVNNDIIALAKIAIGTTLTYSASATYTLGAYTLYQGNLYRCITAITVGESFNVAKWTAVSIISDLLATRTESVKVYEHTITNQAVASGQTFLVNTLNTLLPSGATMKGHNCVITASTNSTYIKAVFNFGTGVVLELSNADTISAKIYIYYV